MSRTAKSSKQPALAFALFVDLLPYIKSDLAAKKHLYTLLAELNTYKHITRIFVLNDDPNVQVDDELDVVPDKTKESYFNFGQEVGNRYFFSKTLDIESGYQLTQLRPTDIVYLTSQDNITPANLQRIYNVIPNPNVITIKINTQSGTANQSLSEVGRFLALSPQPLTVRISELAMSSNKRTAVLNYIAKYRKSDPIRYVNVYSANDSAIRDDTALFNMFVMHPEKVLSDRITSVTTNVNVTFLAKLFTAKSSQSPSGHLAVVKTLPGKLGSKLRRITRKLTGRVSSRLKLSRAAATPSSARKISKAKSKARSKPGPGLGNFLKPTGKILTEIARLDTLIAESGEERQRKQKKDNVRQRIADVNKRYRQHRVAYVKALMNLFKLKRTDPDEMAKARIYELYNGPAASSADRKVLEKVLRVLDSKSLVQNMMAAQGIPAALINVTSSEFRNQYRQTIKNNIATDPGFMKKMSRKLALVSI